VVTAPVSPPPPPPPVTPPSTPSNPSQTWNFYDPELLDIPKNIEMTAGEVLEYFLSTWLDLDGDDVTVTASL